MRLSACGGAALPADPEPLADAESTGSPTPTGRLPSRIRAPPSPRRRPTLLPPRRRSLIPPAAPTDPTEAADEAPMVNADERTDADKAEAILRGNRIPTEDWDTDFTRHTVPLKEFLSGGPRRDQIPPLDEPEVRHCRGGGLDPRAA